MPGEIYSIGFMTINAALEAVKDSLPAIKTLIYADLNESNYLADALQTSEYPLLLILPITVTEATGVSGIDEGTFEFNAYFLDKQPESTTDYSSADIETRYIAPMRLLARQYMHILSTHSIVAPGKVVGDKTYTPEYGLLDAHLFGVNVRCQIPVLENINACT
jgi:hypothetical protein